VSKTFANSGAGALDVLPGRGLFGDVERRHLWCGVLGNMVAVGAVASEAVDGGRLLPLGERGEALGVFVVDVTVAHTASYRPDDQ
jgi:hypothetical protein